MKRTLVIALSLLLILSVPVSAHPEKSDIIRHGSGDDLHYHHGYPAHQHTDFDGDGYSECPFNPGVPFVTHGANSSAQAATSPATSSPAPTAAAASDTSASSSFDFISTIIIVCIAAATLIVVVITFLPLIRELKNYKIDRSPEALDRRHRKFHLFLRRWAVLLPCFLAATVATSVFDHFFHPEKIFDNIDDAAFFGGSISGIFVALCYGFFTFWLPRHIFVDWQHTVPPRKERHSRKSPEKPSQSSHTAPPQTSSDLTLTKEERSMLLKFRSLNPDDQAAIRSTIEQAYKQLSTADHPNSAVNSHKFCEITWRKVQEFCTENDLPTNLGFAVPIWVSFYYCITEVVQQKKLSTAIYSQFMAVTCEFCKIPMTDQATIKSIMRCFDDTLRTLQKENIDVLDPDAMLKTLSIAIDMGNKYAQTNFKCNVAQYHTICFHYLELNTELLQISSDLFN